MVRKFEETGKPTDYETRLKHQVILYNAVSSGKVSLDDINEEGIKLLGEYVLERKRPNHPANFARNMQKEQSQPKSLLEVTIGRPLPKPEPQDFYEENADNPIVKYWAKPINDLLTQNPIGRGVHRLSDQIGNWATLGASHELKEKAQGKPYEPLSTGNKNVDTAIDIAGAIGGTVAPGSLAYKTFGKAGETLAGRLGLGKLGTEAARGASAGLGYELMRESVDAATNDRPLSERLGNIALGGVIGGVADPLVVGIGGGVRKALEVLKNRKGANQEVITEILALPAPKPKMLPKGPEPSGDVIYASGKIEPLALPAPNILPPTRARVERQANPYRLKFERLVAEANQRELTPGRELEELESLWSSMADRDDPDLMTLIDLAYPKKRTLSPNLVQQARKNQLAREMYGVGLPVRSMADRYTPVINQAFPPKTIIKRIQNEGVVNPLPPSKNGLETNLEGQTLKLPLGETQKQVAIADQNPIEQIKQQIDFKPKAQQKGFSFDRAYAAWVDELHALNKATKELGGKLPAEQNPYIQARLAKGVPGKVETLLKGGIYQNGQKVGKSLEEIIKPIEDKLDDFTAYAVAKRALDYEAKGLKSGVDPKTAEAVIRQLDPQFKEVHQELIKFNDYLLDNLVDAGVLSPESVQRMKAENPNYIPMFRVQDEKVGGFAPLKRTFANLGDPIKKRTGSERKIINPIESIIKNTYQLVNIAERNRVGRSLLNLATRAGDNGWARVIKREKGLNPEELADTLDKATVQAADGKSNAVDELFKSGKGNEIYVYQNGQKVKMEVQEDLYRALMSLDTQKQNFFINLLSKPTQALRAGAVLSPDFGPVNIFRDQFSAFINSKYGFIPFWDMFKGLSSVLKKDETYWLWKDAGGANGILSTLDREYLQKDLRNMVKQSLWERVKHGAKHPLQTLLEPLRTVSGITEEATRVGEFKKALKKGASLREAAFASRDLIDFNRAGYLGKQFNQVTAFFNAAVQSMDKLVRTFKEDPKGATIRALTSITLPSLVAYAFNHDKLWYNELPQRERDLYWHFQIGDQIYKLPKPFEAGILFGSAAERALEYMKSNDPESFKGFETSVKDAFTPNWIPTAILPWIEVYANKSMYFDAPIVPRREERLLPKDQYGPYTSELSKAIGSVTNLSPRKIDHLIKGYTGGLGGYGLKIGDYAANLSGIPRPILPDRGLADLPIINRFVVKNLEGNNESVNRFYDVYDQITRERESAKKRSGSYGKEHIYKAINKYYQEINDLQAQKRAIIDDMNMTPQDKAKRIRELDTYITQKARLALEEIKK